MKQQEKMSNQTIDGGGAEGQKILFPDEIRHLTETKQKLDAALAEAEETVLRRDREYKETKQYMVDYRNEMDGHEKLQTERLLQQTDYTGAFAVEMREEVASYRILPILHGLIFCLMGAMPRPPITSVALGLCITQSS